MTKVKFLTSANREGAAIANGSSVDLPEHEAVALVKNGLAAPEGWTLPVEAPTPAAEPSLEELAGVDEDEDAQPAKPSKRPAKK